MVVLMDALWTRKANAYPEYAIFSWKGIITVFSMAEGVLIDLSPNDWLDFPRNSARWKILQQSLLLSSWAFSSGRNYVSVGEDKAILLEPYIALFTSTMTTLVMSPLCKHLSNRLVYLVEEILHENGFSLMEININYTYLLALCPFPCDHPHTSSQNLLALIFSLFYMKHVTNELNQWHN